MVKVNKAVQRLVRVRGAAVLVAASIVLNSEQSPAFAFIPNRISLRHLPMPPPSSCSDAGNSRAYCHRYRNALHESRNMYEGNDFDDLFSDDFNGEGEALAKAFYDQLRVREMREKLNRDVNFFTGREDSAEERLRGLDREPFGKRREINMIRPSLDSTGKPSAGLFARQNGSVYGFPAERVRPIPTYEATSDGSLTRLAAVDQIMNYSSEHASLLQMVVTVAVLGGALYIIVTGGVAAGIADQFATSGFSLQEISSFGESISFPLSVQVFEDTAAAVGEAVQVAKAFAPVWV